MKKSKSTVKKLALTFAVAAAMICCGATAVTLTGCKGNNDPSGVEQSVPINVSIGQFTGGNVTADKTSYVSGDTVTLTITASEGYEFASIKIGEEDKTKSVKNGVLVLENVTQDITVTAVFNARTAATASVSVKDNKGGTATLSKTSGYVGDKVNLSVSAEMGYSVISVKVNGAEKVGELDGGVLEITLTEAVLSVEVEFCAIPVKVTVSSNTEYGAAQITDAKETYQIGDTIEVTFTPQANCSLVSVSVNGEEKITEVGQNKLSLTVTGEGNVNITAVFDITPVDCDFNISATNFGEAYDIKGASVTLRHKTLDRVYKNVSVSAEGKITGAFAAGEYTLEVDGCVPVNLTVTDSGVAEAVEVTYMPFKDKAGWDFGSLKNNELTRTDTENGNAKLIFKDKYTDFVFTTTLKYSQARFLFQVKLSDDKVVGFSTVDDENNIIQFPGDKGSNWWTAWDTNWHDASSGWGNFKLTADEISKYTGTEGIQLKFVRKCLDGGSRMYIFIGDRLAYTYNDTLFLGGEAECAIVPIRTGTAITFPVTMSDKTETADALVKSEITVATGIAHGSVALDREDGVYYIGEKATVTVTPAAGADENHAYVLDSFTVGGTPVQVTGTTYEFTVTEKSYEISATFKEVGYGSIDAVVMAEKYGEKQTLSSVYLSGSGLAKTQVNLANGTLQQNKLPVGEYTVEADGYSPVKINVTAGNYTQAINLRWYAFDSVMNAGITETADKYTVKGEGIVKFKDTFDGDFVYTVSVKHFNQGDYRRVYLLARLTDSKKTFCIGANSDNWQGVHLMDVGAEAVWSSDEITGGYIDAWTGMSLTDEEWAADQNGGLILKLARKGQKIYLFVGYEKDGTYTQRLLRYWDGGIYSEDIEFAYVNYSTSAFETPIYVSKNPDDIGALGIDKTLDVTVKFEKYGAEQSDINKVKLFGNEYALENGKLTVQNLPDGDYKIEAADYAPHGLNLATENNKTVTLQYQLLTNAKNMNIDTVSEGYVDVPSWGQANLKDSFTEDFVFTMNVKHFNHGSYKRTYFLFRLVEENKFLAIGADANLERTICLMDVGGDALWTKEQVAGGKLQNWETLAMNDDEWAADQAGGVTLKLVRSDSKMYLFTSVTADGVVTDRLIKTFDSEEISGEVQLGLINIADTTFRTPVSMDTTEEAVSALLAKVPTE